MKGIVFTEFMDMVEQEFGYDMVDTIIEKSDLPSGGIYTSVGTYDHSEVVQLLTHLSNETKVEPDVLLKAFGRYIFDAFVNGYPQFFEQSTTVFQFLESIDNYIHVEVQKLYPDATLPRFDSEINKEGEMRMIYKSERKMSALAIGLIEKTIEFYKEDLIVLSESLNDSDSEVMFIIKPA